MSPASSLGLAPLPGQQRAVCCVPAPAPDSNGLHSIKLLLECPGAAPPPLEHRNQRGWAALQLLGIRTGVNSCSALKRRVSSGRKSLSFVSEHFLPYLGTAVREQSAKGVALPPGCCPRVLAMLPELQGVHGPICGHRAGIQCLVCY